MSKIQQLCSRWPLTQANMLLQ